jgi:response regulator RpfG family c-di-GMP phosphodiesterase
MFRNYLVVSGNAKARESLAGALRSRGYTVTLAGSGAEALLVVKNVSVDSVLIDAALVDTRVEPLKKQIESLRPECRVLPLTSFASVKGTKELLRFGEDDFLLRKGDLVELLRSGHGSEGEAQSSPFVEKSKVSLLEVIDVLVGLLELGDRYFGGSSHQAMRLARSLAEELSPDGETLDEVAIAALLRDIGKAGIGEDVLAVEGGLSEQQMRELQGHVEGGLRLLEHIDFPWKVLPVIRHHHERYDGRGYPDGLKGREIPIGSRILAVIDAYLAMVSDRPHRPAMTQDAAFDELVRNAGSQFDPEVVEVFISMLEKKYPGKTRNRKFRILIADQNEEFRNLLKLRLVNDNFEVEVVSSVDEAMDKLMGRGADIVLADARPGSHDSLQLIREMREDESMRAIPFILLSDRDDRVLKVRALRLGVDDFVVKNVDLTEMVARVENVLTREAQRREVSHAKRHRGLAGRLETMALPDILQTLHIGMKTALVTLTCGKITGKIWFEEGSVSHAKVENVEGEDAFYTMLRWINGDFVIEHGIRGKLRTITCDPMFLLMEGLRLLDEERDPDKAQSAANTTFPAEP